MAPRKGTLIISKAEQVFAEIHTLGGQRAVGQMTYEHSQTGLRWPGITDLTWRLEDPFRMRMSWEISGCHTVVPRFAPESP
jgi:hypothetical protein